MRPGWTLEPIERGPRPNPRKINDSLTVGVMRDLTVLVTVHTLGGAPGPQLRARLLAEVRQAVGALALPSDVEVSLG